MGKKPGWNRNNIRIGTTPRLDFICNHWIQYRYARPFRSSSPPGVPSLREAVAQVIAGLDAPITRNDLVQQVLALHPSRSQRPADRILAEVRQHTDLVRLEDGRFAPPAWILRGVRFRYVPTAMDSANGIVPDLPMLRAVPAGARPGRPPDVPRC